VILQTLAEIARDERLVAILILGLVMVLVGSSDYDSAVTERKHYCEMVALYKATDGENGWPAYQGECQ